jgi:hypothetical protein
MVDSSLDPRGIFRLEAPVALMTGPPSGLDETFTRAVADSVRNNRLQGAVAEC